MSAFTEPCAQVRAELNRCAFGTESTTGLHDALAALDRVERLATDMGTALRRAEATFTEITDRFIPGIDTWEDTDAEEVLELIRAVLSAREEGTA